MNYPDWAASGSAPFNALVSLPAQARRAPSDICSFGGVRPVTVGDRQRPIAEFTEYLRHSGLALALR